MRNRHLLRWLIGCVLVSGAIGPMPPPLHADGDENDNRADTAPPVAAADLPWAFQLTRSWTAADADLDRLAPRLGVRPVALHNQTLNVRGLALQINTVVCPSDETAEALADKFRGLPGGANRIVGRDGARVYELLSPNVALRLYARHLVGLNPPAVTWRLRGRMAACTGGDFMAANPLFNELLQLAAAEGEDDDARAERLARIAVLREKLTFADADGEFAVTVAPLTARQRMQMTEVEAEAWQTLDDGARQITLPGADLPRVHDMPTLTFGFTMVVRPGYRLMPGAPAPDSPPASSAHITPDSDRAREALREALADLPDDADRLQTVTAIHRWVVDHLQYGGGNVGSRYGAETVLQQRVGRCWDFSDVFVSLCRAADIPAREVAGWVAGMGGHIWCEVEVVPGGDANGIAQWLAVDCTCPWLGVDERYIALWPADRPLVYLAMPRITRVDAIERGDGDGSGGDGTDDDGE